MALQFADINVLVTTDVHSWLHAHPHPDHSPLLDADFGDLLSFWRHARAAANAQGRDLFLVDNGDVVDGTGLSAATSVNGAAVYPLLSKLPYDALNCGNHELYHDETVFQALLGKGDFIRRQNGSYLSSNTVLRGVGGVSERPLGSPYRVLEGAHGTRLLVFGFLYEMKDFCDAVRVQTLSEAMRAPWWTEALYEIQNVDGLLVLAHMHYADPLIERILSAIRWSGVPAASDVPIQFLAGHSHIRAWRRLDHAAAVLEAGHYADTLGFAAFDGRKHKTLPNSTHRFDRTYLEMNRDALAAAAGLDSPLRLSTADGARLSAEIEATRTRLRLDVPLGCLRRRYRATAPYTDPASAWRLYMEKVAPASLLTPPHNESQWFISSSGALRSDIFGGKVATDDVETLLPFRDTLWVYPRVEGRLLLRALAELNRGQPRGGQSGSWGGQSGGQAAQGDAEGGQRTALNGSGRLHTNKTAWDGRRPLRAQGFALPAYLATPAAIEPTRLYDAIVGMFDREVFARTLGRIEPPSRFDHTSTESGLDPPKSDTDSWLRWARTSLPKPPCLPEVTEADYA